jgi:hypothetical protein
MTINITTFHTINIIDSCTVSNILSSNKLYIASINAKCYYTLTKFVEYECLYKPRKQPKNCDIAITKLLLREITKGRFQSHNLSIDDLQEISDLNKIRKLGHGELSAIAFAKKTNQAFMTDDQKARKLAVLILGKDKVQTTPQLLGWLMLCSHLSDSDIEPIITEHNSSDRPLEKHFREIYDQVMRIKYSR